MSRFNWFSTSGPSLTQQQLERRSALASQAVFDDRPLDDQRFVVVDVETTGLNLRRDQVIAIGAVVIECGAIDFSQQFECTLHRPDHRANASTLIHGIAPSEVASGMNPAEALLDFMEFVGDSPLLAFHAEFDQRMLTTALRHSLGYRLQHKFLDVAELAPLLCPSSRIRHGGLDDWTEAFGLQANQRHNASADALVTAELTLMLFSKARRQSLDSLAALERSLIGRRRRQHAMSL